MDYNSPLSTREREIAELIALGMSNKEKARQLGIGNQTVRNTLVHVFRKTSTRKRTQLAVKVLASEFDSIAEISPSLEESSALRALHEFTEGL